MEEPKLKPRYYREGTRVYLDEKPLSSHAVLGDGWRDINHNAPTKYESVLFIVICDDKLYNNKMMVGKYQGDDSFSIPGMMFGGRYWMPLPDPPSFA